MTKQYIALEIADKCEDCDYSDIRAYADEHKCVLFDESIFDRWDGETHLKKCESCAKANRKFSALVKGLTRR
jgi:hypothetical protein